MGGACTKGDTLSPTSKAQEFVQNIRADSTVPVISNDDQADDHIERALFPLHPSVQLHDSIPELPRTCATVTSNARTVLIELFTSQGCPNCPNADALISEVAANPHDATNVRHVIALSFHTPCWDYLGHADTFAHQAYRQRHRAYAEVLEPLQSAYTPQLVVQGQQHVVGSNRVAAVRCIQQQAAKLRRNRHASQCTLSLRIHPNTQQQSMQVVVGYAPAVVAVGCVQQEDTQQTRGHKHSVHHGGSGGSMKHNGGGSVTAHVYHHYPMAAVHSMQQRVQHTTKKNKKNQRNQPSDDDDDDENESDNESDAQHNSNSDDESSSNASSSSTQEESTAHAIGDAAVMIALVEDGRSTNINKGENKGAVLRNDRIVRGVWCLAMGVAPGARGRVGVVLQVPAAAVGRVGVVAWLQQVHSLRVDAVVQAHVFE